MSRWHDGQPFRWQRWRSPRLCRRRDSQKPRFVPPRLKADELPPLALAERRRRRGSAHRSHGRSARRGDTSRISESDASLHAVRARCDRALAVRSGALTSTTRDVETTVEMPVTVVAIYRPPVLLNTPTIGEPPKDLMKPSGDVAMATATTTPLYPPNARDGGVVLLRDDARRVRPCHRNPGRGICRRLRQRSARALAEFQIPAGTVSGASGTGDDVRAVRLQDASREPTCTHASRGVVTAIFRCIVVPLSPASDSSPRQLRRAYWAWIAVCVSWGTTFLATRVAIESIPPFAMAGLPALHCRHRPRVHPADARHHAAAAELVGRTCTARPVDDRLRQRLPRLGAAVRPERRGCGAGVGDSVLDDRRRSVHAERRADSEAAGARPAARLRRHRPADELEHERQRADSSDSCSASS